MNLFPNEAKPDISILIPVHNVEEYILRCLNSLFSQQFSGTFEVIAVDDASTDKSLQLLKLYQQKKFNLKIIEHGVNKKLSITRSTAMQAASGQYILHVDADDWLVPGSLENLFKKCKETNADVIVFNYLRQNAEGNQAFVKGIDEEFGTTNKQEVQKYFFGGCWNKIVKRVLTIDMVYGTTGINFEEDLIYATEILLKAENIYLLPQYYYVWYNNPKSITGIGDTELFLETQNLVLQQLETIVNRYEAHVLFTKNLLAYFENRIHVALAQIKFGKNSDIIRIGKLITVLFLSPIMSKTNICNLKSSINSKIHCFVKVSKFLGLKSALGIVYRSYLHNKPIK